MSNIVVYIILVLLAIALLIKNAVMYSVDGHGLYTFVTTFIASAAIAVGSYGIILLSESWY